MKAYRRCGRQSGFSLLVAMIFLVIMAMLGVTASHVNTLQERMAGHTRDRDIALQAAEAALRDAEATLTAKCGDAKVQGYVATNGNSAADWDTTFGTVDGTICANCFNPPSGSLPTTGTGAVAYPPEYLIESKPGPGVKSCSGSGTHVYRVTARGVGGSVETTVILQAEYQIVVP